ncbi:RsmB/NOP family class I SAM-dependent RNA methyltransferase [Pedobacter sp. BS3]|uniref:RsmB/NOP family class I SAM-dependent RNA methyltransferase n=1 Tax=Pedobacter sp. BS3 TaxID=2567937 RepID=UPI0011EC72F5|nr:RsmB/NOP family class I SAM-dependent RNA methyltransferase [Pedobacter sp. BS3]TZF81454.1 RsmB/NOP family class I SAM-dependent RNA methyltransferase [Pedobacter sp. BS3]
MKYSEQHLRTFLKILEVYPQDEPLAKFLPGYFRQHKQMGSSDRRTASRLLYNYFRLGKACTDLSVQERLFIAEFLCHTAPQDFLAHFSPELNQNIALPLAEKITWLENQTTFRLDQVFPFTGYLSAGIDKECFLRSFFIQPDLFIRLRRGKEGIVKSRLDEAGVLYHEEGESALRLANGTKLDQLFPSGHALFEVQDLSSQQTGNYFKPSASEYWWDACAASGGKSLLLFDQQPDIQLLVSDIRESVLNNLEQRFFNAGLRRFQRKQLDLTQNQAQILHHYAFHGIILDAPCSGSGTWGRTPEMISQFNESRIDFFQNLQKTIAGNVLPYLKPGKPLIYITCSAFRAENEDVVAYLEEQFNLIAEEQQLIAGYETKADTMFVARLVGR